MNTYKIKLKFGSGLFTPFQADTIFGHFCWIVAHQKGEEGLKKFLQPFKEGKPPFILSDGFPADFLPKPLSSEFNIEEKVEIKETKKIEWVDIDDFNQIRQGVASVPELKKYLVASAVSTHNTINRLTNTTLQESGIYSFKETIVSEMSIYFKVISDEWKDKVEKLFRMLSNAGYGKRKSIGKGQFLVDKIEPFEFNPISDANGFVTISNFCPAENDPIEGLYKTFVKYGKLGEEFTFCGNPFKKPLLMIKSGSVFKTDDLPKEFYGRIVDDGISLSKLEVVQYAYAFSVPIMYPKLTDKIK